MNPLQLVEQCYNRLPAPMRAKPWEVTEHGRKVLQTEEELNAYIAAYGEMHIVKCRAALQNFPFEELEMFPFEIFDWGCGQGLATLTLLDMLYERKMLSRLKRIFLIEPSIHALKRAEAWVRQSSMPSIEIIAVNKYIPNDKNATMPEITCSTRISVNLFSNILDIRTLSLAWLANKVSSLAPVNFNICIGPKFTQNTNTRVNDFCGYFQPQEYFSNINAYPYAYTSRTHHAFGCEAKCFIHRRETSINNSYKECADFNTIFDPYDYSTEVLNGIEDEDILKMYTKLRQECGATYDVFFRPAINSDTVDFLLLSKSKGIILVNTCKDISSLDEEFNRIESVKANLFNIHLRTIKIDSIIFPKVYNCVKTALYFPNIPNSDIEEEICRLNKQKNPDNLNNGHGEKDYFKYMLRINNNTNLYEKFERISAEAFRYEYYEEITNLIASKWHTYKDGDSNFYLTPRQKEIVRSVNNRVRVKGVAGCGKTQVVANRAVEQHLRTGDKVLIITFNISLIQYIRMRIEQVPADFAPSMFEITNYHQFFKSKANQYTHERIYLSDFDNAHFFDSYRNEIKKYKTIIIDEIQDFKESWIQSICWNFLEEGGSISLFGDGEQNIYDREMEEETKMPPIHECGFKGRWNEMSERLSMRILNPKIATLSSNFSRQFVSTDARGVAVQQDIVFNQDYIIKYWFVDNNTSAETLASNIRWIFETYHTNPAESVVLAQSINLLRDIENAYTGGSNQHTMINFETKSQYEDVTRISKPMYIRKDLEEIRRAAKTHFTTQSPNLKLSTIHSFKGWESNSIILILQPEMGANETFEGYKIQERENTPALIYTALTRAKCNLFILNLGNIIYHNFFSKNI